MSIKYMDRTDSGVQQSIHEKLEYYRVVVNRKSLIYVPKWIIAIKAGEHTYHRKALAASSTLIVDEIAFCPNHFSLGKIWSARRRTSAVCEICGGAFCNEHIFKTNNMYYCEKHKSAAQEA